MNSAIAAKVRIFPLTGSACSVTREHVVTKLQGNNRLDVVLKRKYATLTDNCRLDGLQQNHCTTFVLSLAKSKPYFRYDKP